MRERLKNFKRKNEQHPQVNVPVKKVGPNEQINVQKASFADFRNVSIMNGPLTKRALNRMSSLYLGG
jgi:hypothetical protein